MFKKLISGSESLPKEVSRDMSLVLMTGNEEIKVQNFYGILKYDPKEVILRLKKQRMFIRGHELDIRYFSEDEVCICGLIESIVYLGE